MREVAESQGIGLSGATQLVARLPQALQAYREQYQAYYERCKRSFSPKRVTSIER